MATSISPSGLSAATCSAAARTAGAVFRPSSSIRINADVLQLFGDDKAEVRAREALGRRLKQRFFPKDSSKLFWI